MNSSLPVVCRWHHDEPPTFARGDEIISGDVLVIYSMGSERPP